MIVNEKEIGNKKQQFKLRIPEQRHEDWLKEENYLPKLKEQHR